VPKPRKRVDGLWLLNLARLVDRMLPTELIPGWYISSMESSCVFARISTRRWWPRTILISIVAATPFWAQSPPASPARPWHSPDERQLVNDGKRLRPPPFPVEPDKVYSLGELIDLAEAHNPDTRVAWENARAQAESLGIARSELYPLLSAVALAGVDREEIPLGTRFYRHTDTADQVSLDLNYTIFDFGARRGQIAGESAWARRCGRCCRRY